MIDTRADGQNVVDISAWQRARTASLAQAKTAQAMTARSCRHCGAGLMDGESEDDCSSAGIAAAAPMPRKFYAD
jgi:hypothetical protein